MFRNTQYERGNDPIRESRTARSSLEFQRVLGASEAPPPAATYGGYIKAPPPCSYLGPGDDCESEKETPEEVRLCLRWLLYAEDVLIFDATPCSTSVVFW
jgi:hypothetical protein